MENRSRQTEVNEAAILFYERTININVIESCNYHSGGERNGRGDCPQAGVR